MFMRYYAFNFNVLCTRSAEPKYFSFEKSGYNLVNYMSVLNAR